MKRRALLSVGGGTLLMPRIAQALPSRIAVLGPDATDGQGPVWDAFVNELARRDQVVGRDIVFERRFGSGDQPAELERLAQELATLRPDLIYAARGTASALAAERASVTNPTVFFSSGDPVRLGLVASLAQSGALEGALISVSRTLGVTMTIVDVGSVDEIDAIAARLVHERFSAVIAAAPNRARPRTTAPHWICCGGEA